MKKTILILPMLVALTGCAGNSQLREQNELYRVSMVQYQDYSCAQVRAEMRRISNLIQQETVATQDKKNEYLSTALNAFAIARGQSYDDGRRETEVLKRFKAQYNALDQLAVQKSCLGEASK